jgi:hypothetical protein
MSENLAPVLAHIHVPKCAGTSVRKVLEDDLGQSHLALYFGNSTTFVYEDAQIAAFLRPHAVTAFSSHFMRRFPFELGNRRIHYVTFLREPVQQFISYITYAKKNYAAIQEPVLLSHLPPDMPNLSIRECARWILDGDCRVFRNFRENYATNFFARYPVLESHGFSYSDKRYRRIRLRTAQAELSNFLFVGISEQMDKSWQLLRLRAKAVGMTLPDMHIPQENYSWELRGDLSWIDRGDDVGRKLLHSVAEDAKLYRWALDRFERQDKERDPGIEAVSTGSVASQLRRRLFGFLEKKA